MEIPIKATIFFTLSKIFMSLTSSFENHDEVSVRAWKSGVRPLDPPWIRPWTRPWIQPWIRPWIPRSETFIGRLSDGGNSGEICASDGDCGRIARSGRDVNREWCGGSPRVQGDGAIMESWPRGSRVQLECPGGPGLQ